MLIHSIFASVEGEGPEVGTPTVFVRFAGCDFKCPWCDTKESWNTDYISPQENLKVFSDITSLIGRCRNIRRLSITGGNPMLQVDSVIALIEQFAVENQIMRINIEYPGSLDEVELESQELKRITDAWSRLGNIVEKKTLNITMDIKLPRWDDSEYSFRRCLRKHALLLSSLKTKGVKKVAKFIVDSPLQVQWLSKYFEDCWEEFYDGTLGMVKYYLALIRNPDNTVNADLTRAVLKAMLTDMDFIRFKLNPNLHTQLGIK